jgi:hypothetical protein
MTELELICDAEIKKLAIALQTYQDTAARQRGIAAFWRQNCTLRDAQARRRAALKLADKADEKARDIERLIRAITNLSEQERTRAKRPFV